MGRPISERRPSARSRPVTGRRLITGRWRNVPDEAVVDPTGDGNMFSFYYRSRLDIGLAGGGRFKCEDIRPGCPGMVSDDGFAGDYSYLKIVTRPDGLPALLGRRSSGRGRILAAVL